jgi:hypothetical protein
MQGFSKAVGESNSNSVWNSAILFWTKSLKRLRPKIIYSWGDWGRQLLLHQKINHKNQALTLYHSTMANKEEATANSSLSRLHMFFSSMISLVKTLVLSNT